MTTAPIYLILLAVSSKFQHHIYHNDEEKPEPFAPKPALGVLWKILSNPKMSSTRHLPWAFFGFLPQRRKYEGVGARDAQRQKQEPSQRPHGEQRLGGKQLMVGLSAVVPERLGT